MSACPASPSACLMTTGRGRRWAGARREPGLMGRGRIWFSTCDFTCVSLMRQYLAVGSPLHHMSDIKQKSRVSFFKHLIFSHNVELRVSVCVTPCVAASFIYVSFSTRTRTRTSASASGASPVAFHTSPITSTRCASSQSNCRGNGCTETTSTARALPRTLRLLLSSPHRRRR